MTDAPTSEAPFKSDVAPVPTVREQKDSDVHIGIAKPLADESIANGGYGMALGLFVPIMLVMCLVVWVFYAYRNPHTKSGQLLIQVSVGI